MRASEFDLAPAAGCILYAEDTGRYGFQQRSDSVTDPGVWSTWGGGREPGETEQQCVLRELAEESGYNGPITLRPMARNRHYQTFVGIVPQEFEPQINSESQDWCWVNPGHWPKPLHPDLARILHNITESATVEPQTAMVLTGLGRFFRDQDPLADLVPQRRNVTYALHPDKWQATFFSLTNRDPRKLRHYRPRMVSIPPGTLIGDMAIANQFYRAGSDDEKQRFAKLYGESLKPYPADVSSYRMPELLMPRVQEPLTP